jgi:hypothetical protein
MRYAHIQNGQVVNVVLADIPVGADFVQSDTAQIGDIYSNGTFSRPQLVLPVPAEVTPAQFRRALNQLGFRNLVENAVSQADQDTKDMWEYSLAIHRDNELLISMANQLNIDVAALDQVFILAATL